MGSKFFINYLRQKWCQINDLYVAVALYCVCRYRLPSALWTSVKVEHCEHVPCQDRSFDNRGLMVIEISVYQNMTTWKL